MSDTRKMLANYAENGSESAFRELVDRYTDLVHSTALRLVNGDSHLAQDIAQTVFVDLARKAGTLSHEVTLGGWLHRHTCFVAVTTIRGQRRRQFREKQAVAMNTPEDHTAANLALVAPILDEAINQLEPEDRAAILLRFFEQREFREVGDVIGATEDAARMRVGRALDKLHLLLKNRGVTLSAAALATALAAEAVTAAPAGMAATLAGTALAGAATAGTTATLLKLMTMTKLKIGIIGAMAVGVLATPVVIQHQSIATLRQENQAMRQQVEQLASLQSDNARLSNLVVQLRGSPAPAEDQVRELARLRNEVGMLRDNVTTLRGQTNSMAKLQEENQQLHGRLTALAASIRTPVFSGPGTPSGVFPTAKDVEDACINNLRLIDSAKQQWALEMRKRSTDTPEWSDLQPYIGRGPNRDLPICPSGGAYTIGTVGEKPRCSIAGHELP